MIPVWSPVFIHYSTTSFYPKGFLRGVLQIPASSEFLLGQRIHPRPQNWQKNLHFGGIWVCLLNLGVLFEGTKRVKVWHVCLDFFAREHNFKNLAHTIDCGFPSLKILEVDCYKISHAKLTQFFNLAAEKWWVKLGIGVRCVWQKLPLECSKTHTVKQLGSPGRGFPP